MAVAVAKSTAVMSLAKTLMGRNIVGVLLLPVRGMLSQAKVVDVHDDVHDVHNAELVNDHKQVSLPQEETYRIHTLTADSALKVNLENVSNSMQKELLEHLGPVLYTTTEVENIPLVCFNHLSEDIFIHSLNNTFRNMGYRGTFTRYNHDKGLATFKMVEESDDLVMNTRYSYFRSGQPNQC